MVPNKSLDEVEIIAALLCDAHASFGVVFNTRSLRLTLQKVRKRYLSEGSGFLTKTLPRLGKHFDQALTGITRLNANSVGFEPQPDSELPRFLGEFFNRIFHPDGSILPDPDAKCVCFVRHVLYLFYKYELPYNEVQEHKVLSDFKKSEEELADVPTKLAIISDGLYNIYKRRRPSEVDNQLSNEIDSLPRIDQLQLVTRVAKRLLAELFSAFDPTDIIPSHGPGVVATKQRLSEKFLWTNVSDRITAMYPFDAYFCASPGHVCDTYGRFSSVDNQDHSARVILVPKDSRGPRLISCEPVDFQWVQQGLRKGIYRLVENHPLTKWNVFFTDQGPNQKGALLGSSTGRYATLDLKEASDRVHLDLVRLLFPDKVLPYLEAARSTSTVLPNGEHLTLRKFAPMGSALCFPIMALTIWALLTARAPNADTRESILVYGDDVIVPTAFAGSAIAILEEFGLKINHSKSCIQGSFRESCGVDAFNGINVTPVRIRTVWNESPRPDVYTSWISYANSFYDRQYYACHEYIVSRLEAIYGPIPSEELVGKSAPSLRGIPADRTLFKRRFNKGLQKSQIKVRVEKSSSVDQVIDGWSMLLRYFTESARPSESPDELSEDRRFLLENPRPFSVSRYTKRHSSMLVWRWR